MRKKHFFHITILSILAGVFSAVPEFAGAALLFWLAHWILTLMVFRYRTDKKNLLRAAVAGFQFAVQCFAVQALFALITPSGSPSGNETAMQIFSLGLIVAVGNALVHAVLVLGVNKFTR